MGLPGMGQQPPGMPPGMKKQVLMYERLPPGAEPHPSGLPMFDDRGNLLFTHEPNVKDLIRQRQYTLDGLTLEDQVAEIQSYKLQHRKEKQKLTKVNEEFKVNLDSAGILRYVTRKHGTMPAYHERTKRDEKKQGIFERQQKFFNTGVQTIGMGIPEWLEALLELTGVRGVIEHVKEDRLTRAEPDYVHKFPEVGLSRGEKMGSAFM